jgi:hypothetical protein
MLALSPAPFDLEVFPKFDQSKPKSAGEGARIHAGNGIFHHYRRCNRARF